MNKSTIALAAAVLSLPMMSFAALPTGASPFQVNIPNLKSGFTFNLTGLYLRPSNEHLDYVVVSSPAVGSHTSNSVHSVKPKHHYGFHVGIGYTFPNSGNDVQIGLTRLNTDDSNSMPIKAGDQFGYLLSVGLFSGGPGHSASGDAQFKYTAVDFNVGQYVNFGTRLSTRFFAGLRYAYISKNLFIKYVVPNDVIIDQLEIVNKEKVDGVGPQFGVSSRYHITNNIGVEGSVSAALIVSRLTSETLEKVFVNLPNNPVEIRAYKPNAKMGIVPNLEAKLGVNYSYPFNGGIFDIAAGYQTSYYYHAFHTYSEDLARTWQILKSKSSFAVAGPYVSLSLKV